MAEIVDLTDALEKRKFLERFARLSGLAEKQAADIEADPMPHLVAMATRYANAVRAIEDAKHALRGTVTVCKESDAIASTRSMASELRERNQKALAILEALEP
jgi:hypothetical protein